MDHPAKFGEVLWREKVSIACIDVYDCMSCIMHYFSASVEREPQSEVGEAEFE
jgi:hypothetical protein